MIGKRYSEKHNRTMGGFDERVSDGANKKRVRIYEFNTRDEAKNALDAIRRRERETKYGIAPAIKRPTLHELIAKRLPLIAARSERTRSRRVLFTWLALLDPKIKLGEKFQPAGHYQSPFKVDEVKTAHVHTYIEKRKADGQAASSINRELTIIAAALNQAGEIFAELEQWKKPKIPKLKVAKSRRERLVSNDEYTRLIAHLRRPEESSEGKRPQDRRTARRARPRGADIRIRDAHGGEAWRDREIEVE